MKIEFVGFEEFRNVTPEETDINGNITKLQLGPINSYLKLKIINDAGNKKVFNLNIPKEMVDFLCEKPE